MGTHSCLLVFIRGLKNLKIASAAFLCFSPAHVTGDPSQESLLHVPDSFVNRMDLQRVFPDPQPVEIDLGCGDGSFVLNYAQAHPDKNFLAIERLRGRLRKIDRKGRRMGLTNLRGMLIEIGYFVQYLLPESSVHCFHIYFPDPWPKKRHHKNRLIQPEFLRIAHKALEPDGIIYLRTDNREYFEQMLEVFEASSGFSPTETPDALKSFKTDFEADFNREGVSTCYAAYAKAAG